MFIIILQLTILISFLIISGIIIFNIGGFFIKKEHFSSITNSYFHAPDKVWNVLNNIEEYPEWRSELVDISKQVNGSVTWKEYFSKNDLLKYEVVDTAAEKRLVIHLKDNKFPVDLKREYTLWQQDYMSFLKVEDQLTYKKSYLCFLSKMGYNHYRSVETILKDLDRQLEKKFGPQF